MSERNLQDRIHKLLREDHLLSAVDIQAILSKNDSIYNKTSVYRALEQMVEKGVVCKNNLNKSRALYELKDSHHDHLICKKCGNIFSVKCSYNQPKKVNGFKVDHHHLTLIGICKDCIL